MLGPVLVVSLWAGGVAVAAIWYGKEVGLTNNVGMSCIVDDLEMESD